MRLTSIYPKSQIIGIKQVCNHQASTRINLNAMDLHKKVEYIIEQKIACNIIWKDQKPIMIITPDQKHWIWANIDNSGNYVTDGVQGISFVEWSAQYRSSKIVNNHYHIFI